MPQGMTPIPEDKLLPPRYLVSLQTGNIAVRSREIPPKNSYPCKVTQNKRITAQNHWQDVRHIILKSQDPALHYEPGDVAVVYPQNHKEDVDIFLDTLHWTDIADQPLHITSANTSTTPLGTLSNSRSIDHHTLGSTDIKKPCDKLSRYLFRSPPLLLRTPKTLLLRFSTCRKIR